MKRRWITAALTLAVILVSGTCSLAGTTVDQIGMVNFADKWINGTDLLAKPDGFNLYVLADMDGHVKSGKAYGRVGREFYYGFVTADVAADDGLNGTGVLDTNGKEVVPCNYGDIKFENEHWILAFVLKEATADQYDYESWTGDGYYLIDHVDFYYADDEGSVTQASSLTRDAYNDCAACGRYIIVESRADGSVTPYDGSWTVVETPEQIDSIYDEIPGAYDYEPYRENGRYGIKDTEGNIVLEPTYGYIGMFRGGCATVENNLESGRVKGLIDTQGNVLVPAEYDDVLSSFYGPLTKENGYIGHAYNNYGYYAVIRDDKLGFVDEAGNLTCDFTIAKQNCDINGASATYTDMGGNTHILAADGTDTDVSQYDRITPLNFGSGMYYKVTAADYTFGVVDWHGEEIIEAKYDSVDLSGDGQYLLLQEEYGGPCELVKLTFTSDAAPADAGAAADGGDAAEAGTAAEADDAAQASDTAEAAEGSAEEAAAPAEAGGESGEDAGASLAARSLIDVAITLAGSDAAANKEAIISTLDSVSSVLAGSKPEVKTVIDSTITLINSGTVDGSAITNLLNNAKTLLG